MQNPITFQDLAVIGDTETILERFQTCAEVLTKAQNLLPDNTLPIHPIHQSASLVQGLLERAASHMWGDEHHFPLFTVPDLTRMHAGVEEAARLSATQGNRNLTVALQTQQAFLASIFTHQGLEIPQHQSGFSHRASTVSSHRAAPNPFADFANRIRALNQPNSGPAASYRWN